MVWSGKKPGVYTSWDECKAQVDGVAGARYKSFDTRNAAEAAFRGSPADYIMPRSSGATSKPAANWRTFSGPRPDENSLCVDGAWNTATGFIEYRGVYTATGTEVFRQGPYADGTNNIAEFLAIVHALAWMQGQKINLPIYSDSRTALAWVKKKHPNTKLTPTANNAQLFNLLNRAVAWLQNNNYPNKLLKWDTENWGEIPADFGRK